MHRRAGHRAPFCLQRPDCRTGLCAKGCEPVCRQSPWNTEKPPARPGLEIGRKTRMFGQPQRPQTDRARLNLDTVAASAAGAESLVRRVWLAGAGGFHQLLAGRPTIEIKGKFWISNLARGSNVTQFVTHHSSSLPTRRRRSSCFGSAGNIASLPPSITARPIIAGGRSGGRPEFRSGR